MESKTSKTTAQFDNYVELVKEDVLALSQSHDECSVCTLGESLRKKLKAVPKSLHEPVLRTAAGDNKTFERFDLVFSP